MIFSNKRKLALLAFDILFLALNFWLTAFMVTLDSGEDIFVWQYSVTLFIYLVSYVVFVFALRVFRCLWRYATYREYLRLAAALTLSTGVLLIAGMGFGIALRTVYFVFGTSNFILLAARLFYSFYGNLVDYREKQARDARKNRTLIIGAGWTADTILPEIQMSDVEFNPVCLLDDSPEKQGMSLHDVPIVGNTRQIEETCVKYDIQKIIFAIPSCPDEARKRILNDCVRTKCKVKVLPHVHELIARETVISQVRDIKVEDLLGREVASLDSSGIDRYIRDKVVMVTGGGGSIGSELCRQIVAYKPKKLVVVDIYENNAYDIQQELLRTYKGELDLLAEITSVADYDKMNVIFEREKPQIVFHAAAHKHVPLMETVPEQAIKNNVIGTFNVARLCAEHGAEKFVLISTDKAVNPTNVMGATKRCCEMIMQYMSRRSRGTEYCAVRFGNVLGSNGSVIPLFKKQIEAGGPVTVTHPDIIRYFMTIPEAVSLVMEAGALAKEGEIFILDMGDPVKIRTLAENLIKLSGYEPDVDIKIEYTGLRPGEKLYEELLMDEEGKRSTSIPKVFIGKPIELDDETFLTDLMELGEIAFTNDVPATLAQLKKVVPTFHHQA